jgi:tetratricopeptide (TPR) repeat protein
MVKCVKCGYDVPGEAAFCPKCGTAMARKMSDVEISRLIFRRFGKKYDEALEAAYSACVHSLEDGSLHKNLLLRFPVPDLMPRESEYQDETLKRFIDKHKDDPRLKEALAHYKLGLICENGRKLQDAIREYDRAVSSLPDFASALLRRGMIHDLSKKLQEALRNFLAAGRVDPQFSLAFFDQGLCYKRLRKRDEALESYERCVALDPDNAAAHNNMGLIYIDKRDFESAEREFREVLRIFPNHPTGIRNLELTESKIGRGLRKFF